MQYTYVLGIFWLLGGVLSPVLALPARAAEPPDSASSRGVVISEINWGGSGRTAADEWLELANLGGTPVDVGGWAIGGAATSGQALALAAGTIIEANGVLLIANYQPGASSTLAITADLVSTALSLPNSKLELVLLMPDGTYVDGVSNTGTPDYGSTTPVFASMERDLATLLWHTATASVNLADASQLGTPGLAFVTTPVMGTVIEDVSATPPEAVADVAPIEVVIEAAEPVVMEPVVVEEIVVAEVPTEEIPAIETSTTPEMVIVDESAREEEIVDAIEVTEPEFVIDTTSEPAVIAEEVAVTTDVIDEAPPAAEVVASEPEVTVSDVGTTLVVVPESAEVSAPEAIVEPETIIEMVIVIPVEEVEETIPALPTLGNVILSELLSSPTTGDEWIEVFNADTVAIDVSGWQVRDASGKTTSLTGTLAPGAYLVLSKPLGKLNNGGDTVELVGADGSVVDTVTYGTDSISAPKHDASLSRLGNAWFATAETTPGAANAPQPVIVEEAEIVASETAEPNDSGEATEEDVAVADEPEVETAAETAHVTYSLVATATPPASPSTKSAKKRTSSKAAAPRIITSLAGVADDTRVSYEGTVIAMPGTFGSQIAVIDGTMLYMNSAEWPALAIGDIIRVVGVTSTARGEQRIKLVNATAISVIGHEDVVAGFSAEAATPSLITVRGTILARQGSSLTLLVDGRELTVEAHERTGIAWSSLSSTTLTVTGVLRTIDGMTVLMPRSMDDVVPETVVASATSASATPLIPVKPIAGAALFVGALGLLGYWFAKSRTLIPSV